MAGPANQRAVASIVFALVTLSAPLHAQSEADVWGAVVEGDLGTLTAALDAGVDPDVLDLLLDAGADREVQNNNGLTPRDLVSDPWSDELEGLYEFLGSVFQMELDIDRVWMVRPEVRDTLRAGA